MPLIEHKKLLLEMKHQMSIIGLNNESVFHACESMIQTSLRGVDSHGVNLFPHYIRAIKSGRINKNPNFLIRREAGSAALLDADCAIGHHSGYYAMSIAMEKAKINGIGAVAVTNSTHFGAASYFGLAAANKDYIGLAFTNADALVKAHNAKEAFFGTNPICFTAPLSDEDPFCLDMATSIVSWNKINNHKRTDSALEDGWAFDKNGEKTTSPKEAASLAPIGSYKGFGLGMMVDILCATLAGGIISKDILPMYNSDISHKRNIGHFFMAIDISSFVNLDDFKKNLQDMVGRIRYMDTADFNQQEVMVAGDPEKKEFQKRVQNGIPIDDIKFDEFLEVSQNFKGCLV